MARLTTTNCEHFEVLCIMFGKERDRMREMDQVKDAESSEERLTDITTITSASQISIWRMGKVIEVFTANHPLKNLVNTSQRLFPERSTDSFAKCFGHASH